jgi:hypothetical protein
MSGLLAVYRLARWPFLALTVASGTGCAVYRLARWPLVVLLLASCVGCGTFDHADDGDDDDDYAKSGYRHGGSASPGRMNARPGYLNG